MTLKAKWPLGIVILLLLGGLWWQFGPRAYTLRPYGHKFEYLEPAGQSDNRAARLTVYLGYEGRRPRWWGRKITSQIDNGHEWSFSNGINVQGGGGFAATAVYNEERDCYQYELDKGLTAYQVKNGQMVAVAGGDATQCKLTISFQDPQTNAIRKIPLTFQLREGQEEFRK